MTSGLARNGDGGAGSDARSGGGATSAATVAPAVATAGAGAPPNASAAAGARAAAAEAATDAVLFCGSNKWDTNGRDRRDTTDWGDEVLAPHRLAPLPDEVRSGRAAVAKLASGAVANHAVLLTTSGRAYATGRNDSGQLGIGEPRRFAPVFLPVHGLPFTAPEHVDDDSSSSSSSRVAGKTAADSDGTGGASAAAAVPKCVDAACGRNHTLFLLDNGDVYVAGANESGQLGLGTLDRNRALPPCCVSATRLSHLADTRRVGAASVACGDGFSAIVGNGELYTFGTHRNGVLGHGTTGESIDCNRVVIDIEPTPRRITRLHGQADSGTSMNGGGGGGGGGSSNDGGDDAETCGVTFERVACGQCHALALDATGRVWSWGFGGYGRLGHRSPNNELRPRSIADFERFRQDRRRVRRIFAGAMCNYVVTQMGTCYHWGVTKVGGESKLSPVLMYDLHGWAIRSLAVGTSSTMAACSGRTCIAWGPSPACGELGFGDTVVGRGWAGKQATLKSSPQPRVVEPLEGVQVSQVAMGQCFTFLLVRARDNDDKVAALPVLELDPAAGSDHVEITNGNGRSITQPNRASGRKRGARDGAGADTAGNAAAKKKKKKMVIKGAEHDDNATDEQLDKEGERGEDEEEEGEDEEEKKKKRKKNKKNKKRKDEKDAKDETADRKVKKAEKAEETKEKKKQSKNGKNDGRGDDGDKVRTNGKTKRRHASASGNGVSAHANGGAQVSWLNGAAAAVNGAQANGAAITR